MFLFLFLFLFGTGHDGTGVSLNLVIFWFFLHVTLDENTIKKTRLVCIRGCVCLLVASGAFIQVLICIKKPNNMGVYVYIRLFG